VKVFRLRIEKRKSVSNLISSLSFLDQPTVGAALLIIYLFKDVYHKSHQALLPFISKRGLWGAFCWLDAFYLGWGNAGERYISVYLLKLGFILLTKRCDFLANEET